MNKTTTYRFDPVTAAMIGELAAVLGVSRTDVIRTAVRKLHRAEKLPPPKVATKGGR